MRTWVKVTLAGVALVAVVVLVLGGIGAYFLNVVITTIGNGISMSEIQMAPGLSQGYTTDNEPFAGTLEMRMDLSRSNLIAMGVIPITISTGKASM